MKYLVIDGTYRDSDGSIKGPGQSIELDDDMARQHQGRVREERPEEVAGAPAGVQSGVQSGMQSGMPEPAPHTETDPT